MGKKIKVAVIGIVGIVIVGALICSIPFILLLIQGGPEMMVYGEDTTYYNNIKSSINGTNVAEINLNNIFKFQWDKAYFVENPGFSGSELSTKLGIKCDINPLDRNESVLRVIFINNNKIAYDYKYDSRFIEFKPLNSFIDKENAIFIINKKEGPIELKLKQ